MPTLPGGPVLSKMVVWGLLHIAVASVASSQLNQSRTGEKNYTAILGLSAAATIINVAFFMYTALTKYDKPFINPGEFMKHVATFLTYTLVGFALQEAETRTTLVSTNDAWFIVSMPLKLYLIVSGFKNGLDQFNRGITALNDDLTSKNQ